MEYELKNVQTAGSPQKKEGVIASWSANVTSGVVGDTYGFVKIDSMYFDIDLTLTGVQIDEYINALAIAFVQEKYPPTA